MSDRPPGQRPTIMLIVIVFTSAFSSGFMSSLLLCRARVEVEADRRARTFVAEAIHQGILVDDHDRIAELDRLADDDRHARRYTTNVTDHVRPGHPWHMTFRST